VALKSASHLLAEAVPALPRDLEQIDGVPRPPQQRQHDGGAVLRLRIALLPIDEVRQSPGCVLVALHADHGDAQARTGDLSFVRQEIEQAFVGLERLLRAAARVEQLSLLQNDAGVVAGRLRQLLGQLEGPLQVAVAAQHPGQHPLGREASSLALLVRVRDLLQAIEQEVDVTVDAHDFQEELARVRFEPALELGLEQPRDPSVERLVVGREPGEQDQQPTSYEAQFGTSAMAHIR
jgi:hypothetical protein